MNWFKLPMNSNRVRWFAVTGLIGLCTACATTSPVPDTNVKIHFPSSEVITTVKQADKVLDDVTLARAQIDWRFKHQETICYDKFFVNACLLDAKKEQREDSALVKRSEVAANYFKRKNNVEEMDRALVEKNLAHPLSDPDSNAKAQPSDLPQAAN